MIFIPYQKDDPEKMTQCAHPRFNYVRYESTCIRYTWHDFDVEDETRDELFYNEATQKNIDGECDEEYFECTTCGKRFNVDGEWPNFYPTYGDERIHPGEEYPEPNDEDIPQYILIQEIV